MIVVGLKNFWKGENHYTGVIIHPIQDTVNLTRKFLKNLDTKTNRFLSFAHLKRYAIKWCIDNLGDEWLLQDYDCYGPYRPIACKGEIKRNFNALALLANRWEATPLTAHSNKAIDLAWLEWKDLVNMD